MPKPSPQSPPPSVPPGEVQAGAGAAPSVPPSAIGKLRPAPQAPAAGDADGAESDATKTIVSAGPIVPAENAYNGLRPRDLGKALVGQMMDAVRLERFVGGGGMGAVFRGHDVALDRTVAVKVLATHHTAGADLARRFAVEAQSAARLDHPNIARIFHVGQDRGLQYIVLEFIEGMNLRDLVAARGPLPVAAAVSYGMQIADALAHAWRRRVVHRDIKPSNVLITPRGEAKLVDMGLARMHHGDEREGDLTATGATLGTFDYIAPEQARDPRSADTRSDIYALGCTLFFALTGRPPFPDGTALQKLLRHQGDDPPDLRHARADAPRDLERLISRMLAKRPASRFQDPEDLLRVLKQVAGGVGLPAAADGAPSATRGGLLRHAPWLAGLVTLAAGLVAGETLTPQPRPVRFAPLQRPADQLSTPRTPASGDRPAVAEGAP